jgi:uncharacterized protein YggE
MRKSLQAGIAVLLLGISDIALSQAAGNYLYNNPHALNADRAHIPVNQSNNNSITLKAEVLMNVKATSYTAIFALTQNGRDAHEADSLLNLRLDQVRYALDVLGIPKHQVHVDAVSMVPTYAYQLEEKKFSKHYTEVPTGLEMKKNVHVLFKHHELLDRIISEMAFVEIYDLVKVEYNIDGMATYHEELRKAALEVIHQKERTYGALNFHLSVMSMSDGFNCSYPSERYKTYTAFYSGSSPAAVHAARMQRDMSSQNNIVIQGKNNTVKVDGSLTAASDQQFVVQTAEKNKTIFYDRMPYNQFDKVINADNEEPCIQFYYTIQVQYSVMNDETYKANEEQKILNKKYAELNKTRKQKRLEEKLAKL